MTSPLEAVIESLPELGKGLSTSIKTQISYYQLCALVSIAVSLREVVDTRWATSEPERPA